jgi:hypothetical protein
MRVDGAVIAEHVGGHAPFEVDLTDALAPGATGVLEVEVHAPADERAIPQGNSGRSRATTTTGCPSRRRRASGRACGWRPAGAPTPPPSPCAGDSLTGFDVTVQVAGSAPAGAAVAVAVDGAQKVRLVADAIGVARGRVELADPRLWS